LITVLRQVPASLVAAIKQKVSQLEEDAEQLFEQFASSFDDNTGILEKLESVVTDFIQANLSDTTELVTTASSCLQAQQDAIKSFVSSTGK
jgi:gas vesicle protein